MDHLTNDRWQQDNFLQQRLQYVLRETRIVSSSLINFNPDNCVKTWLLKGRHGSTGVSRKERNRKIKILKKSLRFEKSDILSTGMKFGAAERTGKEPVRSKICINNKIIEQVKHFSYLGYQISYEEEKDLKEKIIKFNRAMGIINQTILLPTATYFIFQVISNVLPPLAPIYQRAIQCISPGCSIRGLISRDTYMTRNPHYSNLIIRAKESVEQLLSS
ncbi:hypothetical protein ANN_14030 [Periplaneta americana]|uniref:Uncharacterized protein n=1 Tax=Periplaneta americana TaxID=6978 RepID=A0ABQ8SWJ3_PERAM|nr:hypothetical protein ANN_14030 [Periplaneta americana]